MPTDASVRDLAATGKQIGMAGGALQRIPESRRKRAFFACWTRKEAVATGDGLSLPLDQFNVTVAPEDAPRVLDFAGAAERVSDWTLYAVDVGTEYVAAVAAFRCG